MQDAILMIDTQGGILRSRDGVFEYLCAETLTRYAPGRLGRIQLPPRTKVTTDALLLALAHEIELVLTDRRQQVQGRLWNGRFGSIATIRRHQAAFTEAPAGLCWLKGWLAEKCQRQHELLFQLAHEVSDSDHQFRLMSQFDFELTAKQLREEAAQPHAQEQLADERDRLRGLEGSLQRTYFQCISSVMPKGFRFKERSRRPAQDRFNAALNYLYGILYTEVESALLLVGLDPAMGVLHADEHNRPALVFDFIEPYRVWADTVLVKLGLRQMLDSELFTTDQEGVWLNSAGRRILAPAFLDYLDEVVEHHNKRRSRREHMRQAAQALATLLKDSRAPAEAASAKTLHSRPGPPQMRTSEEQPNKATPKPPDPKDEPNAGTN